MFRSFARKFLPNRFDWMLRRMARNEGRKILLCWNRGLGDIALGLYAMVDRIRELVPDAEITFMIRENLREGFSMLEGVRSIVASDWKRGGISKISPEIKREYDLVIENPSPTDWVYWQKGKVIPRLKWDSAHERLNEKFGLEDRVVYVGVQVAAETNYGLWRNWPLKRWEELFELLEEKGVRVILFGYGDQPRFNRSNLIDLRGKTTLFELLSVIKNRLYAFIAPDSGIASMIYYLDASFPLRLITLWADPAHGILKQNVPSPNRELIHLPLIGKKRDLSSIDAGRVMKELALVEKAAPILLAGGQGTRLGFQGPKGLFPIGGKTLFQRACEKIPKNLPLAVMTSPLNHEETVSYFEKNRFFGLEVHFFKQEMGPILNAQKQKSGMEGPNGNGNVFRSFAKAGLGTVFAQRGIDWLIATNIDNPLADPIDRELISFGRAEQADAAVQCIERDPADSSMGVLSQKEGRLQIIEYTELDPAQSYRYAYTGQLAFSLPFFSRMGEVELPLHWVRKTMGGETVWKGEQFIFDVLSYADKAVSFCVERTARYAPLKEVHHIETVEERLRQRR